jgi:hypothetical protein
MGRDLRVSVRFARTIRRARLDPPSGAVGARSPVADHEVDDHKVDVHKGDDQRG